MGEKPGTELVLVSRLPASGWTDICRNEYPGLSVHRRAAVQWKKNSASVVARACQIRERHGKNQIGRGTGIRHQRGRPWFGSFQIVVVTEKRRQIQTQPGMDLAAITGLIIVEFLGLDGVASG